MKPERYAQMKRLFQEAAELDDAAREEFFSKQCGDDLELRQEVEELLAHHDSRTILPQVAGGPELEPGNTPCGQARNQRLRAGALPIRRRVPRLGPTGRLALTVAVVALLLAAFGIWQRAHFKSHARQRIREQLTSLLDAKLAFFEHSLEHYKGFMQSAARDPEVVSHVQRLVELASTAPVDPARLRQAPERTAIREKVCVLVGDNAGYAIWSPQHIQIAEGSAAGNGIGNRASSSAASVLADVFRGEAVVFMPSPDRNLRPEGFSAGTLAALDFVMPLRDNQGRVIAALVIFWRGEGSTINRYLQLSHVTDTSEAYLFDRRGHMCTDSRFYKQLREVGLVSDGGVPRVPLRDPGGDLTAGHQPKTPPSSWPLTTMARHAIAGEHGADANGYRNYLGVKVVGAWQWLPKYDIGIAAEVSYAETFAGIRPFERQTQLSFALLAVSALVIVYSVYRISRLRGQVEKSGRLGQYTLEQFLGEGGMGKVYRARHAMLKRPVAVKFLKPDQANPRALAWFEREVQLASELTHPNTIEIYDYGTSPEGVFFYVMEYLPGITFDELVKLEGPLPWPRAVYLLRQVCASLREAHEKGLVHRDIKPQNIMLCERGLEWGVVKVLDFGLVKHFDTTAHDASRSAVVAGTPQYMAPERLNDPTRVDVRSDIYSVGAVGFQLLTSETIFAGKSEIDVLMQVLNADPPAPSQRTSNEIPRELDQLMSDCLAKDMSARPQSVADVIRVLDDLADPDGWNQSMARRWWELNGERIDQLQ